MALKKGYIANPGVVTDGNFVLLFLAYSEIEDPENISAALLNGPTSFDATYDGVPDGLVHTPGNEELESGRLTLPQAIKREGKQTDTFDFEFAFNPELKKIDPDATQTDDYLKQGQRYWLIMRDGIEHDQDFKAGDIVTVAPVECGRISIPSRAANKEYSKKVSLKPVGKVLDEVTLVA